MEIDLRVEDYRPGPPADVDVHAYGIGLIGCGGIANGAHLPAYQKAGYRVVACCDVQEEAARATAERWGIPFWTTDVRKLLERGDVKIIDLAIHPQYRLDVLKEIARAPRPVLTQKPLHMDVASARALVEFAEQAGIMLAVNQQARWAPNHRALRVLLDRGVIGQLYSIHHLIRSFQDQPDRWWTTLPNFNIADHGVHYLDLARYFAASPVAGQREWTRLHCSTAMVPGQHGVDPLIYSINIEFGAAGGREPLMARPRALISL
jgi:predicted dehydrogenase